MGVCVCVCSGERKSAHSRWWGWGRLCVCVFNGTFVAGASSFSSMITTTVGVTITTLLILHTVFAVGSTRRSHLEATFVALYFVFVVLIFILAGTGRTVEGAHTTRCQPFCLCLWTDVPVRVVVTWYGLPDVVPPARMRTVRLRNPTNSASQRATFECTSHFAKYCFTSPYRRTGWVQDNPRTLPSTLWNIEIDMKRALSNNFLLWRWAHQMDWLPDWSLCHKKEMKLFWWWMRFFKWYLYVYGAFWSTGTTVLYPSIFILLVSQWRDVADVVASQMLTVCDVVVSHTGGWSGPAVNLCHGPGVKSLHAATVGHHPVVEQKTPIWRSSKWLEDIFSWLQNEKSGWDELKWVVRSRKESCTADAAADVPWNSSGRSHEKSHTGAYWWTFIMERTFTRCLVQPLWSYQPSRPQCSPGKSWDSATSLLPESLWVLLVFECDVPPVQRMKDTFRISNNPTGTRSSTSPSFGLCSRQIKCYFSTSSR